MSLPQHLSRDSSGAWTLRIWVQPGASRSGWAGMHGDRLKVRVAAVPDGGRANRELVRFLAGELGIAPKRIEVVRGLSSRAKTVRIEGICADDLLERLPVR